MRNAGAWPAEIMLFIKYADFTVVCLVAWPLNESEVELTNFS